ncbi:MAG: hypothetical protein COT88_01635 [Candidatus Colwellbacteria bacterium CG10_big_fil_rev_8_21_14_0_10_41_28]|uniref:Uncharacterized protein n=1 Tax=Candidatus Colwellbacteria bacterium CG10_big_fil_rev_8_21_14_0_10_41_28 TaxID=1974539 RepID=A0A2H0VHB2_9BACT|nr:MAG: hypothetical protein COT88_01635 [Candidatus Colwellbacteria bacterium CG10_big_fil_rev_8_21_14_0_10_41_28]
MKIFKIVFSIAIAAIFVISTVTVIFSSGRMVNAGLETYVFKVDNCYGPRYETVPLGEGEDSKSVDQQCEVDYNQAKRDVAGGLSYLLVAAPFAYLTFRKLEQLLKERE